MRSRSTARKPRPQCQRRARPRANVARALLNRPPQPAAHAAPPPRARRHDFSDRLGYPPETLRDVLKVFATGGFANVAERRAEAHLVPRVKVAPRLHAPERGAAITWVGHASFIIQMGGHTFLADPNWSEHLPGRIPRLTRPGIRWETLPSIDGVVISHNHYDHLDIPTLRRLPRHTPFFVPLGLKRFLERKGFTRVTELDWWQTAELRGVTLTLVPAQHWSRRAVFDRNKTLWGGWVLAPPERPGKVLFAGDSGYSAERFQAIGRRQKGIDLALLPIGAYEPRWFMKNAHMDPKEAVQAFVDVGAKVMVPMHWGTFPLSRESLVAPIQTLRAEWHKRGLPREHLWTMSLGERKVFDRPR